MHKSFDKEYNRFLFIGRNNNWQVKYRKRKNNIFGSREVLIIKCIKTKKRQFVL